MSKSRRAALKNIAQKFVQENPDIGMEQDLDRLKHMISTDIRDSLPPQIYGLISAVAAAVTEQSVTEQREGTENESK